MTYKERAAELAAVIEAVTGSGSVYTRERYPKGGTWQQFLALFQDRSSERHGPIVGWEITRSGPMTPESAPDWTETWKLRHIRGLSDADESEWTFHEHLDAVVRAFRAAVLTWGVIPYGLKIEVAEARDIGGVLCHVAECELMVIRPYDMV